jgi:hypothetical protein
MLYNNKTTLLISCAILSLASAVHATSPVSSPALLRRGKTLLSTDEDCGEEPIVQVESNNHTAEDRPTDIINEVCEEEEVLSAEEEDCGEEEVLSTDEDCEDEEEEDCEDEEEEEDCDDEDGLGGGDALTAGDGGADTTGAEGVADAFGGDAEDPFEQPAQQGTSSASIIVSSIALAAALLFLA